MTVKDMPYEVISEEINLSATGTEGIHATAEVNYTYGKTFRVQVDGKSEDVEIQAEGTIRDGECDFVHVIYGEHLHKIPQIVFHTLLDDIKAAVQKEYDDTPLVYLDDGTNPNPVIELN